MDYLLAFGAGMVSGVFLCFWIYHRLNVIRDDDILNDVDENTPFPFERD